MQSEHILDFKIKRIKSSRHNIKQSTHQPTQTTKQSNRDTSSLFTPPNQMTTQSTILRRPKPKSTLGKGKQGSEIQIRKGEQVSEMIRIIDTKMIINNMIEYSGKIQQYCKRNNLSEFQISCRLIEPIFLINLQNYIVRNRLKEGQSESNKLIQQLIIKKLDEDYRYNNQIQKCDKMEEKIKRMIEDRLKKLLNL